MKKLDLRPGSHAIDISKGSLTCPSKYRHGASLFAVIPRNHNVSVAFNDALWDTEDIFSNSRVPTGEFTTVKGSGCRDRPAPTCTRCTN